MQANESSGASSAIPSRTCTLLFVAVLVVAALLRFCGLYWGIPDAIHPEYSYHPDEAFYLGLAPDLAIGNVIGRHFIYGGTLSFTVLDAYVRYAHLLTDRIDGVNALADAIIVGRHYVAAYSLLTVLLAAEIGRRIAGNIAGLAGALFLALAPAHAFLAGSVRPDELSTLLAVFVTYLSLLRLHARPGQELWICLGIGLVLGVLMALRLPLGVFVSAPLAAAWLREGPPVRSLPQWLFARAHLLLAVAALLAYCVTSPHTLIYPDLFLEGMRVQWSFQSAPFPDAIGRGPGLFQYGVVLLVEAMGAPVYVLALAGLVLGVKRLDRGALLIIATAAPYLALVSFTSWVVVRYALPIVPLLCILAGVAFSACWNAGGRIRLACVLVLFPAILVTALADIAFLRVLTTRDARDQTMDWLSGHVAAGSRVVTFQHYAGDTFFNPVVPKGLVSAAFALGRNDPRVLADESQSDVLVVNDETMDNIERLGDRHPWENFRHLGELLRPGGPYRLVHRIRTPVRFAGMDFDSWFRSQDFRIMRPELRVYRRVDPG